MWSMLTVRKVMGRKSKTRVILIVCSISVAALAQPSDDRLSTPIEWRSADGGNGHFYEHVNTGAPISWHEARRLAGARSYNGLTGHLVTFTSPQELEFVAMQLGNHSGLDWLGGVQDRSAPDYGEPAGGWRWITGEPWGFTAWSTREFGGNDNEPNNHRGGEDFLSTEVSLLSGEAMLRWNDYPESQGLKGFYVEYEPSPVP
jgi:hypothetical protein